MLSVTVAQSYSVSNAVMLFTSSVVDNFMFSNVVCWVH